MKDSNNQDSAVNSDNIQPVERNLTKRLAVSAVFVGVGLVLSYLNPFAYILIFGTRINPFAHLINGILGVLVGLTFACVAATSIAILRFSLGIGTIHAFHGGISGALIVGISSYILRKKYPKYTNYAALLEPIGTVFIGGTIADIIVPLNGVPSLEGIIIYWYLFFWSSLVGCILAFSTLIVLKRTGISWRDFF
jgi:energy coupling factor transporter S component ThiW